jgi:ABC transporter substrate binding protein
MERRTFIAVVSGGLLAAPLAAEGQRGTPPRLCFLTFDSRATQSKLFPSQASPVQFDPFFQRLRDLGYIDGQTLTVDYLSANGQGERFPGLAAECLRLKADIIVVTTTPAAEAAKKATPTIPIVMVALGESS